MKSFVKTYFKDVRNEQARVGQVLHNDSRYAMPKSYDAAIEEVVRGDAKTKQQTINNWY